MALSTASKSPKCLSCIRLMARGLGDAFSMPGYQQIRGKKKLAKLPAKVHIRLIKNMPTYGRRGTILSVAAGLMRNSLYPNKIAEYVTTAQLQQLGLDKVAERDRNYKHSGFQETRRERKERETAEMKEAQKDILEEAPAKEEPAKPDLPDLPSPQRATEILENLIPSYLEFFRSPIAVTQPPQRVSPSIPATSAISAAASEGRGAKSPDKTSIYGSVSTADIAANLKALLAEDEHGSRVVLSPEEIAFVESLEEKDRVKHLGIFEIDIMLKGATDVVRRAIKVSAQA